LRARARATTFLDLWVLLSNSGTANVFCVFPKLGRRGCVSGGHRVGRTAKVESVSVWLFGSLIFLFRAFDFLDRSGLEARRGGGRKVVGRQQSPGKGREAGEGVRGHTGSHSLAEGRHRKGCDGGKQRCA
jgi:hypothetical protein